MSDLLRNIEDARDRARTEIDLELRRHRRRLRVVSERRIKELTSTGGEFDPIEVAQEAVQDARNEVYSLLTPPTTTKQLTKGS